MRKYAAKFKVTYKIEFDAGKHLAREICQSEEGVQI